MANTLGKINPFRYRGYVYDEEAGLYYLRSRYYSPYTCRFINADVLQLGNLFAYCANSPIIHGDRTGYAMTCFLDENGNEAIFSPMTMGGIMGAGAACAMSVAKETSPEEVEQFVEESIDGAVQGMVESLPGAKLTKLLHYNRNIFNQEYSEEYLTKVLKLAPLHTSKAKFHQNNLVKGEPNRKYVIGDWFSSEQVYFSDRRVNNTPEDQGTFNVYSGDNWLLNITIHGSCDVIPYMIWGNSPDDSTTIIDRLEMGIK